MRISVVLPCYNEEGNIERTIRDVLAWFFADDIDGEIVVTNDGSKDNCAQILERLSKEFSNIQVVTHPVNRGYGAALTSGCDVAKGEVIAFMDSDGQFQPGDMAKLLEHMDEYQFVTGLRAKRADVLHRKLNAFFYNWLVRTTLGLTVRDVNCGMKMFRRTIWPKIRPQHATGALFNAEVYYRLKQLDIPVLSVPVPHYPRLNGKPDGARLVVILRMFKELRVLKKSIKHHTEM